MLSATMATKLNEQINREFFSAYLYLALSSETEERNMRGTPVGFWPSMGRKWPTP